MAKKMDMSDHIKAVDTAVDHIAFVRRITEISGEDVEQFDKELDALCTKYHEKYAEMDEFGLAIKGLMDIVKMGKGEDLLDDLSKALKE